VGRCLGKAHDLAEVTPRQRAGDAEQRIGSAFCRDDARLAVDRKPQAERIRLGEAPIEERSKEGIVGAGEI
jgi:hypothetical protein